MEVFEYLILIFIDFQDCLSLFSIALASIEIDQTRKTVFDHSSKYLEVLKKYSATLRMFKLSSQCLAM